jgi:Secretion system C-terminal sorting domain
MKFILQTTRKMGFLAFVLGVCLFSSQTAFSQVRTWDGGAGTTTWSDPNNWSGDALPISSDSVNIIAGANVVVTSNTTVRKLNIYGTGSSQGKVTVNVNVELTVSAAATGNISTGHAVISLFGGMIDNQGKIIVTGRQNLDAIRFDNPASGTLSSTYMGIGILDCNTSATAGSGVGTGGNNGTIMTFAQSMGGTATFTTSSSATYTFTLNTGGTKSIFYCPRGTAKIDGTGTISTPTPAVAIRSIRVIPNATGENPNLTIESGVTMNLSTTVATVSIGMVLLDHSGITGATVSMTNKGTLNFSGDINNPIYMTNPNTASNTTNFTNEGTININGTFADVTVVSGTAVTQGGIAMFGASGATPMGNVFTNSGFINFNTETGGTSPKPLIIASTSPKNVINNSGTITVGNKNATLATAIRLGSSSTALNNTGTITLGAGSINGVTGQTIPVFNNNTNGILNFNAAASNSTVSFLNTGGTFNVATSQFIANLTVNGGTVTVTDGATASIYYLTLTSGHIPLGTGNVTISNGGNITGGSLASHIITNGTGKLTHQVTSAAAVLFPIGQSASSYDPVTIKPAATLIFGARVGLSTTATPASSDALIVNREWNITGTAGTTDLAFSSSALNKDGSSTRPSGSVGVIGHHNGTTWDADIAAVYNSNTWTVTGYTGSFSPFIVALPGAVLSTELLNMTAKAVNNTNLVSWETASETNNKGFDVERKSANGTWASLGFVKGSGKASTYTFEDNAPLSISYYRLRQIDFDGTETFSKVVSVSQNTKGRISITPNPTSDKVNININQNDVSDQTATLVLSDMTGRQVLTKTTTAGAFQLDLSHLAKGMYVMTVQANNAIYQEKIIRQ